MTSKTAAWLVIGTFAAAIASPIAWVIGKLAYENLRWSWWLSCGTPFIAATFALILILEGIRSLLPKFYLAVWLLLTPMAVAWGIYGLCWYLPNALKWDEFIFFLPGVAFGVGLAKVKQSLTLRQYSLTLAAAGLLIYLHILVMHDRTRDLCRWLRGEGIFMRTGGDPAGGMAGALYNVDFSDLDWLIYGSPGVILMAALLAVRPLRVIRRVAVN